MKIQQIKLQNKYFIKINSYQNTTTDSLSIDIAGVIILCFVTSHIPGLVFGP